MSAAAPRNPDAAENGRSAVARRRDDPPTSPQIREGIRYTYYLGPSDVLVAAGLCSMSELPGQPGVPKCMATYGADGRRVHKGTPGSVQARAQCGARRIVKRGRDWFQVVVTVGEKEAACLLETDAPALDKAASYLAGNLGDCALRAASRFERERRARIGSQAYELTVQRGHLQLLVQGTDVGLQAFKAGALDGGASQQRLKELCRGYLARKQAERIGPDVYAQVQQRRHVRVVASHADIANRRQG